jgi:hypothetical protein
MSLCVSTTGPGRSQVSTKSAIRKQRIDGAGELVSPGQVGHRRPPGELAPVSRRWDFDGRVRPVDIERVDAGEDLADLERERP